jgi:hypothetical protein
VSFAGHAPGSVSHSGGLGGGIDGVGKQGGSDLVRARRAASW